ncbi:MAG: carboxymuconolactone decarboxylase family protein [Gemmatimonadaceae bacterium]|nr:carboxymuconolactone decarboxylase family protein [Gemmatimonadaceae bacterium]
MTHEEPQADTLSALDTQTRCLVRLAAVIGAGTEGQMRALLVEARELPGAWVEEVILQSYLFAGFPRTLNAAREWRRISGSSAPPNDPDADATAPGMAAQWRERGAVTCAAVYGDMYEKLRVNIEKLHPALEHWMITDGYGKVLSRPGLDLIRRELCVVAICALAEQDRQLHSHFHGALNVGATPDQVSATLDALDDLIDDDSLRRYRMLWGHVRSAHSEQAKGRHEQS